MSLQWGAQPKVTHGSTLPDSQLLTPTRPSSQKKPNNNTPQQQIIIKKNIYICKKNTNNKETEFQVCKNGYVTFHLGKFSRRRSFLSVVTHARAHISMWTSHVPLWEPLFDAVGSSSTPSSLLSATMVTRALLASISGRVGVTMVNKVLVAMETLFCSSRRVQWFGFWHAASPHQNTCLYELAVAVVVFHFIVIIFFDNFTYS